MHWDIGLNRWGEYENAAKLPHDILVCYYYLYISALDGHDDLRHMLKANQKNLLDIMALVNTLPQGLQPDVQEKLNDWQTLINHTLTKVVETNQMAAEVAEDKHGECVGWVVELADKNDVVTARRAQERGITSVQGGRANAAPGTV